MPEKEPAHIISIDLRKYDDNPRLDLGFYTVFQFCDGVRRIDLILSVQKVDIMLRRLELTRPNQLIGRHVDILNFGNNNIIAENVR